MASVKRENVPKTIKSPHAEAINKICSSIENAQKSGFKKCVFDAIAKWNVIWKAREKNKITETELPEDSDIKKGIHKSICSNCDGDPECCGCDDEQYTEYGFVKKQIEKYIKFVPDLFAIDEKNLKISAIEVEDTHRVSIEKLVEYAIFQDVTDWWFPEWKFSLFIYDRFGNKMGEINLPVYYNASTHDNFEKDYKSLLEEYESLKPRIEAELMGYYNSSKLRKY